MRSLQSSTHQNPSRGFTIIEVLIVVTVMAVLVALLMPALASVRESARKQEALSVLKVLGSAMRSYKVEHQKKYPVGDDALGTHGSVNHSSINRDLIDLLEVHGFSPAGKRFNTAGQLLDPWNQPYRYSLDRPNPASNADALNNWNWDPDKGEEKERGYLAQAGGSPGATLTRLDYPYLWSIGPSVSSNIEDAQHWVFREDGR